MYSDAALSDNSGDAYTGRAVSALRMASVLFNMEHKTCWTSFRNTSTLFYPAVSLRSQFEYPG